MYDTDDEINFSLTSISRTDYVELYIKNKPDIPDQLKATKTNVRTTTFVTQL